MKVQSPDGQVWRVTRRWVPWRQRLNNPDPNQVRYTSSDSWWSLGLLAILELLVELVLLPFAVIGRAVFGLKWSVEVRRGWKPYTEETVGDWHGSGVRIQELANAIRLGDLPEQTLGVESTTNYYPKLYED
jgi:hypothetical protein